MSGKTIDATRAPIYPYNKTDEQPPKKGRRNSPRRLLRLLSHFLPPSEPHIYIPITRSQQQQQHDVLSPVRGRTCVSSAPPRNTLHRRGAPRSRRERSLGGIPNFNAQLAVSSGDCVYGHKERPETGPAFICQTAPAEDYKGAAESARGDTGRMLRVYVYVYTRLSPRDR